MFFIILLLFASSFAMASEHTLDYYLYNSKESFLRDARIYISTLLEDTDSKPSSPFPGAHYTIPGTQAELLHTSMYADTTGKLTCALLERFPNMYPEVKTRVLLQHNAIEIDESGGLVSATLGWCPYIGTDFGQGNVFQRCTYNTSPTNAQIFLAFAQKQKLPLQTLLNERGRLNESAIESTFTRRRPLHCKLYLQHGAHVPALVKLFQDVERNQYDEIKQILQLLHAPKVSIAEVNKTLDFVRNNYTRSRHLEHLHKMLLEFRQSIKKEITEANNLQSALIPVELATPGQVVAADETDANEKTPLTTASSNTTIDSNNETPKKYIVVPTDENPTKNSGSSCNGWNCLLNLLTSKK